MNRKVRIMLSIMIVFFCILFLGCNNKSNNSATFGIENIIVQMHEKANVKQKKHTYCTRKCEIDKAEKDGLSEDEILDEMNMEMEEIMQISNEMEWYIAYKKIVNEYQDYFDPPETIYDYFTDDELNLLFSVVQAEVGDEYSFISKTHVASVIFNRLQSSKFPNSISNILTKGQFQTIANGRYKNVDVSECTILACEYAFQIMDTAKGALYFESGNSNIHGRYATFLFEDDAGHKFYK